MTQTPPPLHEEQAVNDEILRRRNRRSVAIALSLVAFIVLVYLITFAIGPGILKPTAG